MIRTLELLSGALYGVAAVLLLYGIFGPLVGLRRRVCRRRLIAAYAVALAGTLLDIALSGSQPNLITAAGLWVYCLIREIRAYNDDDDDDRPPPRRRRRWMPDLSGLMLPAALPGRA